VVTPDFEDWLARQEIPIEDTLTLKNYQRYLLRELGIHGGSLDVAAQVYEQVFDVLEPLGIRPVGLTRRIRGVEVTETRFGILGRPGLWGYMRAADLARVRGLETGKVGLARRAVGWLRRIGRWKAR